MNGALWVLVVALALGAVACGGSTPATTTSTSPTSYTANLRATLAIGAVLGSPSPVPVAVLYPAFFPATAYEAVVTANVSPPPPSAPQTSWSSSNAAISVTTTQPSDLATPAASTNPYAFIATAAAAPTAGLVTASIGLPVNATLSIPVAAYKGTLLGCDLRGSPAVAASGNGLVPVSTAGAADFYASYSTNLTTPCSAGTTLPTGATLNYNMPYGGIVLSGDITTFPYVTALQWQFQAVTWNPTTSPAILLFKTATGSVVKYFYAGTSIFGPYEVSQNGLFMTVAAPAQ